MSTINNKQKPSNSQGRRAATPPPSNLTNSISVRTEISEIAKLSRNKIAEIINLNENIAKTESRPAVERGFLGILVNEVRRRIKSQNIDKVKSEDAEAELFMKIVNTEGQEMCNESEQLANRKYAKRPASAATQIKEASPTSSPHYGQIKKIIQDKEYQEITKSIPDIIEKFLKDLVDIVTSSMKHPSLERGEQSIAQEKQAGFMTILQEAGNEILQQQIQQQERKSPSMHL